MPGDRISRVVASPATDRWRTRRGTSASTSHAASRRAERTGEGQRRIDALHERHVRPAAGTEGTPATTAGGRRAKTHGCPSRVTIGLDGEPWITGAALAGSVFNDPAGDTQP